MSPNLTTLHSPLQKQGSSFDSSQLKQPTLITHFTYYHLSMNTSSCIIPFEHAYLTQCSFFWVFLFFVLNAISVLVQSLTYLFKVFSLAVKQLEKGHNSQTHERDHGNLSLYENQVWYFDKVRGKLGLGFIWTQLGNCVKTPSWVFPVTNPVTVTHHHWQGECILINQ